MSAAVNLISFADARRDRKRQRETFERVRRADSYYGVQLRKIAKHIDDIVRGFDHPLQPAQEDELQRALERYSDLLRPWARNVGRRMVMEVARRDENAWARFTRNMSAAIRQEIQNTPIGEALARFLEDQVTLITSLPLDAAKRVHELTLEARITGARIPDLVDEIMKTGQVTKSRATLIARTETARTATGLTMVRARAIGSDGYIWRTVQDEDVRKRHRALEGKFIKWDSPPIAGERGERAHAGMIYNCRCFPEPVVPDRF